MKDNRIIGEATQDGRVIGYVYQIDGGATAKPVCGDCFHNEDAILDANGFARCRTWALCWRNQRLNYKATVAICVCADCDCDRETPWIGQHPTPALCGDCAQGNHGGAAY